MFICYSPFIYYGVTVKHSDQDWRLLVGLWIFGLISFPISNFILGKQKVEQAPWVEEGYPGFWAWFKNSKSTLARLNRWSNILALIIFLISMIIAVN